MKILGTGVYLPKLKITNKKIESFGHDNAKWTEEKLGIKERRVSFSKSSILGAEAAKAAIENAGLKVSDIQLIIVATSTPDKMNPSTACIIQDRIKAYDVPAFDINAVCSGFVYGMVIAAHLPVTTLLIGVDTFSHITDWGSRDCVFFGDGSGAVVIEGGAGNVYGDLRADGAGQHSFETPHGGTFRMRGHDVFKAGTTLLPISIRKVLSLAEITINDVAYMLPHQASVNMLKTLAKEIGLPWGRVKTNMDVYGNTAAASIPILLHENKKYFKEGDYILLAAIGSGWAYGSIILKW